MKQSAGIIFYKSNPFQVLLVHPSGNFNHKAKWSIPKGEHDLEKDGIDLWKTACRETNEELAILVNPNWKHYELGSIVYRSGSKRVTAFALNHDIVSNQEIQLNFENDEYGFFSIQEAQRKIHPDQFELILRLSKMLETEK
jgi:predicted NUDIX family NTP pyrophosphohydrolase